MKENKRGKPKEKVDHVSLTRKQMSEIDGNIMFSCGDGFFDALPDDEENVDGWRNRYDEKLQTLSDFKRRAPKIKKGQDVLYIQPIGDWKKSSTPKVGSPYPPDLDVILKYVTIFFESNAISSVRVCDPLNLKQTRGKWTLEGNAITTRKGLDHDHTQLQIEDMLDYLEENIPEDAYCVMAITMMDLFMADEDLFLAGWAGRGAGIFSFARYDPFYLERSETTDYHTSLVYFENPTKEQLSLRREKILIRSLKTVTHEILHEMGFEHCLFFKCLMNGTGNLDEDDHAPFQLCPVCLAKLDHSIGINIVERYEKMSEFFKTQSIKEESDWILRRINYITKDFFTKGKRKTDQANLAQGSRSPGCNDSVISIPDSDGDIVSTSELVIDLEV